MQNECCGNCRYHKNDDTFPEDYICVNDASEHCADWTDYKDYCYEWEGRE